MAYDPIGQFAMAHRTPAMPDQHPDLPDVHRAADAPPTERFVMCPPKYLSTAVPNNVFMKEKEAPDVPRALEQYARLKHVIEAFGTEVLEIPAKPGAQDQTFVANVACAIEPVMVLANYRAPGRAIEVEPAKAFFTNLGYRTIQPPFHFEGEADLKRVSPKLYVGGYGQFTDLRALAWIEQQTGITIVPVEEVSPELYHLDCSLFVLDNEHLLITGDGLSPDSLKRLEGVAELVFTPKGIETTGITNGVKIPGKGIYLSGTLQPEVKDYRKAMEWLLTTMDDFGYVPMFVDTDAFEPSGGDLSCVICHLPFLPGVEPHA
jgi:N-dimethylarginine dimethylaminohydrolase